MEYSLNIQFNHKPNIIFTYITRNVLSPKMMVLY